jgi:ornithine cyclodeaminase/alanine dehydrogenase-like protein (mu-crystallin family)
LTIYIKEEEVKTLVSMSDAIQVVENGLISQKNSNAVNEPRHRVLTQNDSIHLLIAGDDDQNIIGFKTAYYTGGSVHVVIYDTESKKMAAVIEAGFLGALRTGAASAVASKYMANPKSSTMGVFGAGFQAYTQVQAVCEQFDIKKVLVTSRDPDKRQNFIMKLSELFPDVSIETGDSAEQVAACDIVTTATRSEHPVLKGSWLDPGGHVNAIGSNSIVKSEIDIEVVQRSNIIVVDDRAQAKKECGDLVAAWADGVIDANNMIQLCDIVDEPNARGGKIVNTLFESQGIGLWDISLAKLIFDRALIESKGTELPF